MPSPAEALRQLRRTFNLALMANYPGTTASNQFLDDLLFIVTAYAATVEREGRADEVHRYIDRSDSLSEEKYAFRRLAALQEPPV